MPAAKRYGVEIKGDLDLELRLRRIEFELSRRQIANADAETVSKGSGAVPRVTGLRLSGTIPGGFTISWNAVTIADLRRYEVQFSTDSGFAAGIQTFNSVSTTWAFTTASEEDVYYARVRAVNVSGRNGPYSVILNTTTGQAGTGDIEDGAVTDDKIDPDDPISFTGLDDPDVGASLALSGYINGLRLSNNGTDATNDVDISAGVARDSTNVLSITLATSITKRLDGSWASGTGNGGLASALSKTSDTAYFVFLLSDPTGVTVDVGFDTSPIATNLLADTGTLTIFRRIGCVVTDASNGIFGFRQFGDFFQLNEPVQDINITEPDDDQVLTHQLVHIPLGIECAVHMSIAWQPTTETNWGTPGYVQYGPSDATFAANPSNTDNDSGPEGDARVIEHSVIMVVDENGQFKTRQTDTTPTLHFMAQIHGWTDLRGKDGLV